MCGRYVLRKGKEQRNETLPEPESWREYWDIIHLQSDRYNIAPGSSAPVLTTNGLKMITWGQKPDWSRQLFINAQSEKLSDTKSYWRRLAKASPCLIPAHGFYEPKGSKSDKKRPWYGFELKNSRAFFFAGLSVVEGDQERFVILTREPPKRVEAIHSRSPVFFTSDYVDLCNIWMDTSLDIKRRIDAVTTMVDYEDLRCFPVSDLAKSAKNEGPECFMEINNEGFSHSQSNEGLPKDLLN